MFGAVDCQRQVHEPLVLVEPHRVQEDEPHVRSFVERLAHCVTDELDVELAEAAVSGEDDGVVRDPELVAEVLVDVRERHDVRDDLGTPEPRQFEGPRPTCTCRRACRASQALVTAKRWPCGNEATFQAWFSSGTWAVIRSG